MKRFASAADHRAAGGWGTGGALQAEFAAAVAAAFSLQAAVNATPTDLLSTCEKEARSGSPTTTSLLCSRHGDLKHGSAGFPV